MKERVLKAIKKWGLPAAGVGALTIGQLPAFQHENFAWAHIQNPAFTISGGMPSLGLALNREVKEVSSQVVPNGLNNLFMDSPTLEKRLKDQGFWIYDISVETDESGGVKAIYSIPQLNPQNDPEGKNRFLYKTSRGPDGALTLHQLVSKTPLPIAGLSVLSSGEKINIVGEQARLSHIPAGISSNDGGKTFIPEDLKALAGVGREQILIPGTTKALINITDGEGAIAILNLQTGEIIPAEGTNTGFGLIFASVSSDKTTASFFIKSNADRLGTGYFTRTIDLTTGKLLASELKHQEVGYIYAFAPVRDANGNIDKIYVTNSERNGFSTDNRGLYIIDTKTDTATPKVYEDWLNEKEIPNFQKNSLQIYALNAIGNRMWAGGAYVSIVDRKLRSVIFSWPIDKDPSSNPKVIDFTYRLDNFPGSMTARQQDLKWVRIDDDTYGFLTNIRNTGLFFIQTDKEGNPLNDAMFCLNNGLFDLPYKFFLPLVGNN